MGVCERSCPIKVGIVPVINPFSRVAGHVIEAVRACCVGKAPDREGENFSLQSLFFRYASPLTSYPEGVPIGSALEMNRAPGPIAGAVGELKVPVVSPGVVASIRSSRRFFPLGFGRKTFARPAAIGISVGPTDVDDGMSLDPLHRTLITPQRRRRLAVFRNTVLRRRDKGQIGFVRDFMAVDEIAPEIDRPLRLFVGETVGTGRRPHQKFSGRDHDHVVWKRGTGSGWRRAESKKEQQEQSTTGS